MQALLVVLVILAIFGVLSSAASNSRKRNDERRTRVMAEAMRRAHKQEK